MRSIQEGNCVFICWFIDFISLLIVAGGERKARIEMEVLHQLLWIYLIILQHADSRRGV